MVLLQEWVYKFYGITADSRNWAQDKRESREDGDWACGITVVMGLN